MFAIAELSRLAGKILLTIGAVCLVAGLGLQAEPYADGLHRIHSGILARARSDQRSSGSTSRVAQEVVQLHAIEATPNAMRAIPIRRLAVYMGGTTS